jgi:uncharacterized membrane protein
MNFIYSPFIVPVAGIMVAIVAIISKTISDGHARRIKAEQRLMMLQRGMTAEQIALLLNKPNDVETEVVKTKDPLRSLANARRVGVVLVSVGIGLIIFGFLLASILRVREVLSVSASGLIPLAIGIGFFVDYSLQKRELARFGLEVGAELPSNQPPD